jgi:uncharacterized protein (TIGR02001 family)
MKKMLQILLGAAGLASVAASPALAVDNLTANAAFTTDYVFRGISQSAKRPAVSAGLDYAFGDSGFAVGTWVSSINFGDDTPMEWDIYGNYNFTLGPLGASVGLIGYVYPDAGRFGPYDLLEIDAGLSHDFGILSWSGKINYGPSYPNGDLTIRNAYNPKSEYYVTTGIAVPVLDFLAVSGNVSYEGYSGDKPAGLPDDSYTEWDIGATVTVDKYSLDLRYIDTSKHAGPGITSFGPYFNTGPFYVATFSFKFP